jgi:hypothetical protein
MRARLSLAVSIALLASGCAVIGGPVTGSPVTSSVGGSGTTARYGCFQYAVESAPPATGSVLAVDVVATNVTGALCGGPSCGGLTGGFVVTDGDGRAVLHVGPAGAMCVSNAPRPTQVTPGESIAWESLQWDGFGDLAGDRCVPGDCHLARPRAGAGRYRVTWSWLDAVTVRSGWLLVPS